jgi:hypothetical protein
VIVTEKPRENPSLLVRGAVLIGRIAGGWRQRQRVRDQDAFVQLWKDAWVQGCETAWAGHQAAVPAGLSEPQRAAWRAGWTWAQTQPDRRRSTSQIWPRNGRRSADARLVRAAKGGAAGLVVFAATRWLMGQSRSAPVVAPDDTLPADPPPNP